MNHSFYRLAVRNGLALRAFTACFAAAMASSEAHAADYTIVNSTCPGSTCRGASISSACQNSADSDVLSQYKVWVDAQVTVTNLSVQVNPPVDPRLCVPVGYCNYEVDVTNTAPSLVGRGGNTESAVGVIRSLPVYHCPEVLPKNPPSEPPQSCPWKVGNPIFPLTGRKYEEVDLRIRLGALQLSIAYDSAGKLPVSGQTPEDATQEVAPLGQLWFTSFHRRIRPQSTVGAIAERGLGVTHSFTRDSNGNFVGALDNNDRLIATTDGFIYYDSGSHSQEVYDAAGALQSIAWEGGGAVVTGYSDADTATTKAPGIGYLIQLTDNYGRNIQVEYDGGGRLRRLIDSVGRTTEFIFDGNTPLGGISWPDATSSSFIYDDPNLDWALTGFVDENGSRRSTFTYDSTGRAVGTQRAGGVEQYTVTQTAPATIDATEQYDAVADAYIRTHTWSPPSGSVLTKPDGSNAAFSGTVASGKLYLDTLQQAAGAGCAASSSKQVVDVNGNVTLRDDFNGHRSCMAYDTSRNLEVAKIEGLPNTADCTSTLAASSLPTGSRRTETQWHPDWRLQTKVFEPGKVTTNVYNGQPDPFNGGATINCPGPGVTLPTLPDGKPLALLCKSVEQATTDADGHLGSGAAIDINVAMRQRSYTYNQFGQVLTSTDPLNHTTANTYYSDTSFVGTDPDAVGHTVGDLHTTTNALSQVTTFSQYNKAGQVLEASDANNVLTSVVYDVRQQVTQRNVGGQTTTYEYWPTGLLKKVTQPDNVSWVQYAYDDAYRLRGVTDNFGNSIAYTLDSSGNRTAEEVRDPSNVLRRQLTRSIDALGRVQQITGRE